LRETFIFIIFIFYSLRLTAQSDKKTEEKVIEEEMEIGNCENGTRLALIDAKNKIYKSYNFGLRANMDNEKWKFEKFYTNFVKTKYRIEIVERGCTFSEDDICYDEKMNEIIQKEIGENILKKAREEAKILYYKR